MSLVLLKLDFELQVPSRRVNRRAHLLRALLLPTMKLSSVTLCLALCVSSGAAFVPVASNNKKHHRSTSLGASHHQHQPTEGGFVVNILTEDENESTSMTWNPTLRGNTRQKQRPRVTSTTTNSNADAHMIAKKAAQERSKARQRDAEMANHVKSRVSGMRKQYGPSWLVPSLPKTNNEGPVEWITPDAEQAKEVKDRVSSVRERYATMAAPAPEPESFTELEEDDGKVLEETALGDNVDVQCRVVMLREKYRRKQQQRKNYQSSLCPLDGDDSAWQ